MSQTTIRSNHLRRAVGAVTLAVSAALAAIDAAPVAAQAPALSIEEAVARAVESSPELRAARLEVEAAGRRAASARSALLPRADLSFSYSRNLQAPAAFLPAMLLDPEAPADEVFKVALGADNVWASTLWIEQPVLDGRTLANLRMSNRSASLQDEVARGRVHEVVADVRVLYYDLLLARDREALTERSLERVRTSLEQVRALYDAGLASEYDVLRLEVEVGNLEPALRRARNLQREAARELTLTMGMEQDREMLVVIGSLVTMCLLDPAANSPEDRAILEFTGSDLPTSDVDQIQELARAGSSALRQLELTHDVRQAELRREQAAFLPRISVFGLYDVQAQQMGSPEFFGTSGQRGTGRALGVQLTLPLFTSLDRTARVQEVQARLDRVDVLRAAEAERLDARVATLLERIDEARQETLGQRLAVERAERGQTIVSARFAEGLASRLELMDAEVALRETQVNYAEAIHGYLVARARLDGILGAMPGR